MPSGIADLITPGVRKAIPIFSPDLAIRGYYIGYPQADSTYIRYPGGQINYGGFEQNIPIQYS